MGAPGRCRAPATPGAAPGATAGSGAVLCCGARPPPRHERRNSWNKKVNLPRGRSQKAALGIPACTRSAAKLPAQMLAAGQSVMR